MMPSSRGLIVALCLVSSCAAFPSRAQEKATGSAEVAPPVPLKIAVVLSEYDGQKKVASLPYTFYVNADDRSGNQRSQLRTGLRVPIATGTFGSNQTSTQYQYMDIGTNMDCQANSLSPGLFRLVFSVDRSYLYTAEESKKSEAGGQGVSISSGNPIVAHFTSSYNLVIRDGQTLEATSTTDPVSGHVLKVELSATVAK